MYTIRKTTCEKLKKYDTLQNFFIDDILGKNVIKNNFMTERFLNGTQVFRKYLTLEIVTYKNRVRYPISP